MSDRADTLLMLSVVLSTTGSGVGLAGFLAWAGVPQFGLVVISTVLVGAGALILAVSAMSSAAPRGGRGERV